MAKKLLMSFVTTLGTKASLTMNAPKDNLVESDVRPVMDKIITTNLFNKKGDLSAVKAAEVITTTTETLI